MLYLIFNRLGILLCLQSVPYNRKNHYFIRQQRMYEIRSLLGNQHSVLISVGFYNRHITTDYLQSQSSVEIILGFHEYLHVTVHIQFSY